MKTAFNFEQFNNLMRQSPSKAFAYRDAFSLKKKETPKPVDPVAEKLETTEIEVSRKDMIAILTEAKVDFKKNASNITLLELIKTNGLI